MSYNELQGYLTKNGYNVVEYGSPYLLSVYIKFFLSDPRQYSDSDEKHRINTESYFYLLEYVELKEARESALAAQKTATIAIVISIIALLASIAFSYYQITHTSDVRIVADETKETCNED